MNYTILITLASLVGTATEVGVSRPRNGPRSGPMRTAFGKRWCFAVWLFTNAFWCVHNAAIGEWSQALAIVGLIKWRKAE